MCNGSDASAGGRVSVYHVRIYEVCMSLNIKRVMFRCVRVRITGTGSCMGRLKEVIGGGAETGAARLITAAHI